MKRIDLTEALDPTTPRKRLQELFLEFQPGDDERSIACPIASAAACNPNLPTAVLHSLLTQAKWPSAWLNPAVDLCLIERPLLSFQRDLRVLSTAFELIDDLPEKHLEHAGSLLTAMALKRLQETLRAKLPAHPFTERWRDHLLTLPWPERWRDRTETISVCQGDRFAYDTGFGSTSHNEGCHVLAITEAGVVTLDRCGRDIVVDVSSLRPLSLKVGFLFSGSLRNHPGTLRSTLV